MKALTLWRPWPWSILYGGKRVENRPWSPPQKMIGETFAIHAGKVFDQEGANYISKNCPELLRTAVQQDLVAQGIVGSAMLLGWSRVDDAIATHPDQAQWCFGPMCWHLANVYALVEPIPCRGAQGFWEVPADVIRRMEGATWRVEIPRPANFVTVKPC
jgi:hypothetical protein